MNAKSILIIEDESALRETLSDLLSINGFNISVAENGKEGYQKILKVNPDLVICDVNMPGMNGFEVLSTVNSLMNKEIIPAFLFVTARTQLEDIKQGMKLGADDYITKPFESTDLLETIRMRLKKRDQLLNYTGNSKTALEKTSSTHETTPVSTSSTTVNKIALPTADGLRYLDFSKIIKCQADRAYCIFYLKGEGKLIVSKPMKEYEDILNENGFLRVHKSYIVNMNFVKSYIRGKGGYLIMDDGSHVDVSIRKKEELMTYLKV